MSRLLARFGDAIDELLAADYDFDVAAEPSGCDAPLPVDRHREHPHRTPLRSARERRPGRVPTAPAHCISPIRATGRTPGSAAHS